VFVVEILPQWGVVCVYVYMCVYYGSTRARFLPFHRSNRMGMFQHQRHLRLKSDSRILLSGFLDETTSMSSNKMAIARFSKVTAIWSYALCPPQSDDRSQCIPATFHKRYLLKSSAVHRPHEKGLLRSFVVIDRLSFAPHDIVLWHLRL
jgi:hypothetical protein